MCVYMFKNKSILAIFSEKVLCPRHVIFGAMLIPAGLRNTKSDSLSHKPLMAVRLTRPSKTRIYRAIFRLHIIPSQRP